MNIKITFDPPITETGWTLSHHHGAEKPFTATKQSDYLSAETLPQLIDAIRQAESHLLIFDEPIRAMKKDDSPVAWIPIEFFAMRDGKVFYRNELGEARYEFISNFTQQHIQSKYRLVNDGYLELATKVEAAARANQRAYDKVVKLKAQFAKVTDALFMSAKATKVGGEE
jgi:hypothetical protein